MNLPLFVLLLAVAFPLLAGEPPVTSVTKENVFTFYKDWPRLAKHPYEVPWQFVAACLVVAPGSKSAVTVSPEAEALTYGPHNNTQVQVYANKLGQSAADESFYVAVFGSQRHQFDPGAKPKAIPPFKGFPVGATIVKEKLSQDGSVKGVGAMIKHNAGYDSENGDWEFVYAEKNGRLLSGRLTQCADCHLKAKKSDFVFGDFLRRGDY